MRASMRARLACLRGAGAPRVGCPLSPQHSCPIRKVACWQRSPVCECHGTARWIYLQQWHMRE